MLAPLEHLSELPTDQSPTDYDYARLAACAPFIVLFWFLIRHWIISSSTRRFIDRSYPAGIKSQDGSVTLSVDSCCSQSDLDIDATKASPPLNWKLLGMMSLSALVGLFLLGHVPFASSIQGGTQFLVHSSLAPSSTALQDVFQVYQPVPLAPSGEIGCDIELLLMDHVFGASYGAPFVGKRVWA
jgi:hypothetical protein